ncbi:MAG: Spo0E family sporulation regulatory protein-aspartic acid phosphatase [Desulfitobacteriaceae bacterium]|nr:Spo0E family sporulation regulatory protein-aspartic acid phosphatase [Desulfitobacteriaceae bacterium]MDD4752650.1 Spo0E family sporulation regulatory protein-aspartic acid phosphatase [Desulfitobacteriaceae bacterium]
MLENIARKEIPLAMLEFQRKKLEYVVEEKSFDLLNEQVIKASQHMDQVILSYYREKKHPKKSPKGSNIIIFPE